MTKPSKRAEVNNFIQGLITEASPLNYPANASLDEENFELNRNGTRNRRLGMDYEPSYALRDTAIPASSIPLAKFATYKWMNVAGIITREYLVVQTEQVLQFFDLNVVSISGTGYLGTLTLSSFPANTRYSFTAIEGNLIVAAGVDTVAQVSYNGTVFSVEYRSLLVRDIWGIQVTGTPNYETDLAYRGAPDTTHYYNLQNQSWGIPRKDSTGVLVDPILKYYTDLSAYPSNSEMVWAGLQFQPVLAGVTFERMYTNLYDEVLGANVTAPKGYFVIDLLKRGASRAAEFTLNATRYPTLAISTITLPTDVTAGGARVVTEFAGRAWYGGFNGDVTDGDSRSPNLSNYIVFSRLIRNKNDFNKCYQEGDPTSRDSADLVDTDGGFIRLGGAKNVIAMLNLETHLIVICDNGVWTVTGGSEYGFTPTNYKVSKISAYGGISASSVVVEGGRAFYWSDSGVYVIGKEETGIFGVKNASQTTIQTLYESIPAISKLECTGVYDVVGKKIKWLYNTGARFSNTSVTKELVFDTVINAFYQNKIGRLVNNSIEVLSLFPSTPFNRITEDTPIIVGTDAVLSVADSVVIPVEVITSSIQSIRYLAIQIVNGVSKLTFSYYNNPSFIDWYSVDNAGVDAKAYLLTGDQTVGDSAIAKQTPYLIMFFKRTEDGVTPELIPDHQSGCLMRFQWDFANTINSKKWSVLQQVYRYRRALYITGVDDPYDNGFKIVSSKSKIRGRGKAFSLYLETEPLKDCYIHGWSISVNGNDNV